MYERIRDVNEGSEPPKPLLPDDSALTLEEYLAMQRAIGHKTRFQILRTLKHNGDLSANELKNTLNLESNTLHYHLDELIDVGLVQNRKRKGAKGNHSYYRATSLGEDTLEYGVEDLIRRENAFLELYE